MGIMVRPESRVVATVSIAVSVVIVLCALWWLDHERLVRENQTLERQVKSIDARLQELNRSRGSEQNR